MDDADKAEKLIRNLARRLEGEWPRVSRSLLEGLGEILTVVRLGLPSELRRSLACTNVIEKHDGDGAPGEPQCEALALDVYGFALDGCGDAGSQERLSKRDRPV